MIYENTVLKGIIYICVLQIKIYKYALEHIPMSNLTFSYNVEESNQRK